MARDDRTNRQAGSDVYPLVVVVHRDGFPGAVLHTERAANTPVQIYLDEFQQIRMIRPWHYFNTIWGANDNARLTPCTSVLVDYR
jgi:hypothetical protein